LPKVGAIYLRRSTKFFIWALLVPLAVWLQGCGYQLSASAPIALPEGMSALYLEGVSNPTTQSWLEPSLRSALRDEFTRRGQVSWVDRQDADGLLKIDILSYTSGTKLENALEETVRSQVVLRLQATISRGSDQTMAWSSGRVSARESFSGAEDGPEARDAEQRVVALAVEKLADTLGQEF